MCIDYKNIMNIYNNDYVKNLVANDKDISYAMAYPALLAIGKRCRRCPSIVNIKILALSVYGWMPTILDNMGYEDKNKTKKDATNWENNVQKAIKKIIANHEKLDDCKYHFDKLKQFTNNSYVGLSKFLHFLLPEKFAIWDSNVYLALLAFSKINLNAVVEKIENIDPKNIVFDNNLDTFIQDIKKIYSGSGQNKTNNKKNFIGYEKQIREYAEKEISVRDLEKPLFCFGKWLGNLAKELKNLDNKENKEYKNFKNSNLNLSEEELETEYKYKILKEAICSLQRQS